MSITRVRGRKNMFAAHYAPYFGHARCYSFFFFVTKTTFCLLLLFDSPDKPQQLDNTRYMQGVDLHQVHNTIRIIAFHKRKKKMLYKLSRMDVTKIKNQTKLCFNRGTLCKQPSAYKNNIHAFEIKSMRNTKEKKIIS